jgi:hypothetical protein
MPDTTFLAFERGVQRGHVGEVKLEAAVLPDIYGEIDERNAWIEPSEAHHSTVHETAISTAQNQATRALATFLQFVFAQKLTGRGTRTAILKFVALAHFMCPELLSKSCNGPLGRGVHGPPATLDEVAKLLRVKPSVLRGYWKSWRRDYFQFTAHVQKISK